MDSDFRWNDAEKETGVKSWRKSYQILFNIKKTFFPSCLTLSLSKGECHNFMVRQAHHEGRGLAHNESSDKNYQILQQA